MYKKILAMLLVATMVMLSACGGTTTSSTTAATTVAGEASESSQAGGESSEVYHIGIVQLVQHAALDQATQGFKDALVEALGDSVVFDEQNANGDAATATTICSNFVAEDVDLIMANATAALQAAASATGTIPILGTSITDYGVALDIADFSGVIGGNISGTSDCAPLEQQAQMMLELFPDANTFGILYCSAEPNSKFQSDAVQAVLEAAGKTVSIYTFSDSNDLASVTQEACSNVEAIYIPTDNTAASYTETINNVAQPAGIPIFAGEEGIMSGCGVATLSISYYNIGKVTGQMAAEILVDGADISTMEVRYDDEPVKEYNPVLSEALGIAIPEDYLDYTTK